MSNKYYAIAVGQQLGIFTEWEKCEPLVKGFPNAKYKSFKTHREASDWLAENCAEYIDTNPRKIAVNHEDKFYAYTDGSYDSVKNLCGYGAILFYNDKEKEIKGTTPNTYNSRNITGEIQACIHVVREAIRNNIKELTIYHDYVGVAHWALGQWKRNTEETRNYYKEMQTLMNSIKLHFVHVNAHTGIEGNERADRLAKQAIQEV